MVGRGNFFLTVLLSCIVLFGFSKELSGGCLTGRVVDIRQNPIPYASVYIHQLSTGIAADTQGNFRITLNPGIYTVTASSLGYKRVQFEIEIGSDDLQKEIVLEEEVYTLGDVYFSARKENRAYHVMRQAIARAPYHRGLVKEYSSQVYMKGSVAVSKIPALLRAQAGKSTTDLLLNNTLLLESQSNILFKWPNSYDETVVAYSSTIPEDIVDPSDITAIVNSSVYDREFYGKLSPLAPEAFSYYQFIYEGVSQEEGRVINKIRIVPKKGDSKLISGHIYIADDLWNITYARFFLRETGIEIDLKVNYNETIPEVMMPTSYAIDVNISLMGVRAKGSYNSSITYNSVNKGMGADLKTELLSQEEFSTKREARSFARESSKSIEQEITAVAKEEQKEPRRSDLEIVKVGSINRRVDSLATKRDSSYWSSVRMIPLREEEVASYREADSLKEEYQKILEGESKDMLRKSTGNIIFDKILYDSRYKMGENLTLGYGGLTRVIGGFSFTDGYWLGQNFYLSYLFDKHRKIVIEPSLYYSQYRKKLMWDMSATLTHSPMKLGKATLSMGDFSSDLSSNSPISHFVASYSSFLFGMNPVKYHSKRWITVGNQMDLFNGFNLDLEVSWSDVTPLEIVEAKSLTGKRAQSNLPDNIYGALPQSHYNLDYSVKTTFTPMHYFRVREGKKEYVRSSWPTFALHFKGSLPTNNTNYANWASASFSLNHRLRTGIYSLIIYSLEVGKYYKDERLFFDNFHHFVSSDIMIAERGFGNHYLMADPYYYSTPKEWFNYILEYRSNYILINNLPFLNSSLYTEALYLKGIWLLDRNCRYTELGYSFGIQGALKGGLFAAFEGTTYKGIGFRIEIPFLNQIYR